MPNPVALTPDLVETPQITPQAATPARSAANDAKKAVVPKAKPIPLQVRLPRAEVKAIKVAAAQREQTISDFMLACFHAYMKTGKSAS
jgi:hypothetical protein